MGDARNYPNIGFPKPYEVAADFVHRLRSELMEAISDAESPDRIAIDANGYGWRVWDDQEEWSMVPTNSDNEPIPQPVTWFVPLRTAVADMVAEQKRDVGRTLNTIDRKLRRHDLAPDEQAEFDRMYGTRATTAAKAVFSRHQWSSDRRWDDLSMDDQEGFYEVAGAVLAALDSTHDCDDLPFCDDPACPRAAAEWGDD